MDERTQEPIIFILLGATGDLAVKKILPALAALFRDEKIHPLSRIIAVGRRDWKDADFISFLGHEEGKVIGAFLQAISYVKVDIDRGDGYEGLVAHIHALQARIGASKVFTYLSLAPQLHEKAVSVLRDAGILLRGKNRVMIEKPFGTDEKTAKSLDRLLLSFLDESQIYRVDHYLGKDTVQAMMDIHESTPSFDELVSSASVESICVRLFETIGIEGRGATYEQVGAFRDVGQNHMLVMLSAIAAELPQGAREADEFMWQKARADVIERLAPPAKTCELSRRAQYEGYKSEKNVSPDSEVETAFEVVTSLRSGKLKGVPLILEAGKKMSRTEAFVEIKFKDISGLPEIMKFSVQPEREISIRNRDGSTDTFETGKSRDAYENVLIAALADSRHSFVGSEEIEALWRYADHIVACWNKVPLETYSDTKPFLLQ